MCAMFFLSKTAFDNLSQLQISGLTAIYIFLIWRVNIVLILVSPKKSSESGTWLEKSTFFISPNRLSKKKINSPNEARN